MAQVQSEPTPRRTRARMDRCGALERRRDALRAPSDPCAGPEAASGCGVCSDMSETDFIGLRDLAGVEEDVAQALADLGFQDPAQLIGAIQVEGVGLHLAAALGLTGAGLADVVDAARRVVGLAVMEARAAHGAFGALPPTPMVAAEIVALQAPAPLSAATPTAVNLIGEMRPIRDQGGRGTSVAFALLAVHEHARRTFGDRDDLSAQFLYDEAKRIDGAPASCGTWQVKALRVLRDLGVCHEEVWPYNSSPPCNGNGLQPATARADAASRTCAALVLRPTDVAGAKALLAAGRLVSLSIPVYASWANSAATHLTGRITMRIGEEAVIGGHAMCLVGYHDSGEHPGGGYFIVRNSWGRQWASASRYAAGYGTLPYAYVANDGWELVGLA